MCKSVPVRVAFSSISVIVSDLVALHRDHYEEADEFPLPLRESGQRSVTVLIKAQ